MNAMTRRGIAFRLALYKTAPRYAYRMADDNKGESKLYWPALQIHPWPAGVKESSGRTTASKTGRNNKREGEL